MICVNMFLFKGSLTFGIACRHMLLICFENNLNGFGVITKCTVNLDVILPELETEV